MPALEELILEHATVPSSLEIWIEWRMEELNCGQSLSVNTLRIQAKNELQRTPSTWKALVAFHRAADNARGKERFNRQTTTQEQ